jgi:hypothetical protein
MDGMLDRRADQDHVIRHRPSVPIGTLPSH